jgi:hypothetical protein
MNFALINNADNTLVRFVEQPDNWIPKQVAHKFGPEHAERFVPVVTKDDPEFDATTHHLERIEELVGEQWVLSAVAVENPVPSEVPLWAFRAVLTVMGHADTIKQLLETLPEPTRTVARTQWEYANYISRNHPTIAALSPALGLTSANIDAIFRQAAQLV